MIAADRVAFAAALPQGGRLMALDVGTRTIGVAYCDAGWMVASADKTIARTKFSADLAQLRDRIARERIAGLVIGLPLALEGSDTSRTQGVRAFARNCVALERPILLWDERLSTAAVTRVMIAADVSRARRAERIDSAAAAWILEGAIDALRYG